MSVAKFRILIDRCTGIGEVGIASQSDLNPIENIEITNCRAEGEVSGMIFGSDCRNSSVVNTVITANRSILDPAAILISDVSLEGVSNTFDNLTIINRGFGDGLFLKDSKITNSYIESLNRNGAELDGSGVYNSYIVSKEKEDDTGLDGHVVVVDASCEIIDSILEANNPDSNCIFSASAITVNYAKNTFKGATVAVNANITQGITATEDNQGNIIL